MYWYLALFAWAAATANAYFQGAIKLALFTFILGLIIIGLVTFKNLGVIGQTLIAILAIISFISEKFLNIKSR